MQYWATSLPVGVSSWELPGPLCAMVCHYRLVSIFQLNKKEARKNVGMLGNFNALFW